MQVFVHHMQISAHKISSAEKWEGTRALFVFVSIFLTFFTDSCNLSSLRQLLHVFSIFSLCFLHDTDVGVKGT